MSLLGRAAADLPDEALTDYREAARTNRLGPAFTALVAAGQQHTVPAGYRNDLATAAGALCLDELLADDERHDADLPEIRAARVVRGQADPRPA